VLCAGFVSAKTLEQSGIVAWKKAHREDRPTAVKDKQLRIMYDTKLSAPPRILIPYNERLLSLYHNATLFIIITTQPVES
jgi:hypothetical protein